MEKFDAITWTQGVLTAQGYLIELLIGAQIAKLPDPLGQLERARSALQKQMQFDMRVPPTDAPQADHLQIQSAAVVHMNELLDRVRTQFPASTTLSGQDGPR